MSQDSQKKKQRYITRNILRKQAILDHLNTHGKSTVTMLAKVIQTTDHATMGILASMLTDSEIAEQLESIGGYDVMVYLPKRNTTAAVAPDVIESPTIEVSPGRIVYKGTERNRPIPNQRGQGAVSAEVSICSAFSIV